MTDTYGALQSLICRYINFEIWPADEAVRLVTGCAFLSSFCQMGQGFVSSSLWTLEELPQTHFHTSTIYFSTLQNLQTVTCFPVLPPIPSLHSSPSDFLHSCLAFYSKVSNKPTEACLAKTSSTESESPSAPDPSGGPRASARLPLWGPTQIIQRICLTMMEKYGTSVFLDHFLCVT